VKKAIKERAIRGTIHLGIYLQVSNYKTFKLDTCNFTPPLSRADYEANWRAENQLPSRISFFTITAEIHARSLAKFYGQYSDRHINWKFMLASANESGKFDNLLS